MSDPLVPPATPSVPPKLPAVVLDRIRHWLYANDLDADNLQRYPAPVGFIVNLIDQLGRSEYLLSLMVDEYNDSREEVRRLVGALLPKPRMVHPWDVGRLGFANRIQDAFAVAIPRDDGYMETDFINADTGLFGVWEPLS